MPIPNNKQSSSPDKPSDSPSPLGAPAAPITASSKDSDYTSFSYDAVKIFSTFDEMSLADSILRGIYGYGFERPSPVQQKAIVPIKDGRDMIVQAQAGTGKTGAFAVGLLSRISTEVSSVQALVLSPTRELAMQTELVVAAIGDYVNVRTFCAIGGARTDFERLRSAHVLSATPGRIMDLLKRRAFDPRTIKIVILDEVDVMLQREFKEQVRDIFQQLPGDVQAVVVSATLSDEVIAVADSFLRDPLKILVPVEEVPIESIKQFFVDCERSDLKFSVLCDLYEMMSISKSILFVNTIQAANRLAEQMNAADFVVSVIHSEMSQEERSAKMREFRTGSTRVLIGTDILQRGIDVQQVSVVINVDMPRDFADYIHRVGRCGRLGRSAVAINLLAGRNDFRYLDDLMHHYRITIPEMPANVQQYL
jgi:ATP-dependent RNA helicase